MPRLGHAEAADAAQQGGLPGAVGAEQREHLAAAHVEVDAEQHLHGAVGEVEVPHLQDVVLGVVVAHAVGLGPLLLELLHHQPDVAADVGGAARQQRAADERRRDAEQRQAGADAPGVAHQPGQDRAEEGAGQEHVHADHGVALRPQPVGHHGGHDRSDQHEPGVGAQRGQGERRRRTTPGSA